MRKVKINWYDVRGGVFVIFAIPIMIVIAIPLVLIEILIIWPLRVLGILGRWADSL